MPELDLDLWLSPDDIKKSPAGIFVDVGQKGEIPKEGDEPNVPTFEINVELIDGTKKLWTMNKTSQRAIAKGYGTNTDNWKDKPFEAFVTLQNVRGNMKEVIYAKVPDKVPDTTTETVV